RPPPGDRRPPRLPLVGRHPSACRLFGKVRRPLRPRRPRGLAHPRRAGRRLRHHPRRRGPHLVGDGGRPGRGLGAPALAPQAGPRRDHRASRRPPRAGDGTAAEGRPGGGRPAPRRPRLPPGGTGTMRDLRLPTWLVYLLAVFPLWFLLMGRASPDQVLWAAIAGPISLLLVRRILVSRSRTGLLRLARQAIGIALAFVFLFVPDAVRSTLDMAHRILRPVIPMQPGVVAIPIPFEGTLDLLVLLLHVTLTPGQFVVDYDLQKGILYVHAIDASDPDRIRSGVQEIHRKTRRLTG